MRDKRAEMIKLSKNDVVASRDSDHQAQSSAAILLCFQYVQHTAPVVQQLTNTLAASEPVGMTPHKQQRHVFSPPQQGTAGAEIKAPSVENPTQTDVLPGKSGVGQNIALRALPTARHFFSSSLQPSDAGSDVDCSRNIYRLSVIL